ncbi:hypothetical protein CPLU01_04914 [Colletotrichum plurivorum]|uniref:Uncharacterized protein n=1 Tax=Colletotrichum plurivorum TaxID=2175906 RepID=A0A8H6KMV1_9PEZI|nr:hypothetical protein CPLU01_04914 [Colletotrichum plurivorum]
MKNNPQDQQPQAANLSGQAHVDRESTTACMQQQQHGDLAFGQFRQAALTAIRQILDATTGNRGPLFFEAAQRFFSEAEQAMYKMKKRIRETNAPMINANNNAITQAVDVDRAREGSSRSNAYDSVAKHLEAMKESGRGVGSVEESEGEKELAKNIEAFAQKMKGLMKTGPMEQIQEEMAQIASLRRAQSANISTPQSRNQAYTSDSVAQEPNILNETSMASTAEAATDDSQTEDKRRANRALSDRNPQHQQDETASFSGRPLAPVQTRQPMNNQTPEELNRDAVAADHKMADSFAHRQGDSFVHAGVPLVGNHTVYQAIDNCRPGDEYQVVGEMIFGPNVAIPSPSQVTHEMLQQEAQVLRRKLEQVEARVKKHSPTMNASSKHGTGQAVDDGGAARDDHREAQREAVPEIRQVVDQNDALDSLAPMVDDIIQRLVSFRERVLHQREIEELEAEAKVLMVAAKERKAERRGRGSAS